MPSGNNDAAGAKVKFSGDRVGEISDDSFASRVYSAIGAFRKAEDGWTAFDRSPHCAEPVFSPESDTLKLRRGSRDQVSIYAKARQDGGRATEARWSLLNPMNADFSPSASNDAAPTINYTVTAASQGAKVQVTVRFTSTAGVGEKTWIQDTENESISHIGGSFSGTLTHEGSSVLDFNGRLEFDRGPGTIGGPQGTYTLVAGSGYSVVASGTDYTGLTDCAQTGGEQFTLAPGTGSISVQGTPPNQAPPYTHWFHVDPPDETMTITRGGCPPAQASYEGTTAEIIPDIRIAQTDPHPSPDGIAYNGSESQSIIVFSWAFQGTP